MPAPHEDPSHATNVRAAAPRAAWPRFLLTAAALYAVWIVLSGRFYPQYLIIGAIGSLLIASGVFPRDGRSPFPVLRFLAFLPWLLKEIVVSNLRVARTALSPLSAIQPQFVRVPTPLKDPRALTVLGCAITLTPGTLTLDATPDEIHVHALDSASAQDIRDRVMERRVERMFEA